MTNEQKMAMWKGLADGCSGKEGATNADVEEALAEKMPTTRGGKCLHACVGETVGIVSLFNSPCTIIWGLNRYSLHFQIKDNKVSVEGYKALAAKAYDNDPAKIQLAADMANDCISLTDSDRCEAAAKIIECTKTSAEARGAGHGDW